MCTVSLLARVVRLPGLLFLASVAASLLGLASLALTSAGCSWGGGGAGGGVTGAVSTQSPT